MHVNRLCEEARPASDLLSLNALSLGTRAETPTEKGLLLRLASLKLAGKIVCLHMLTRSGQLLYRI